MSQNEKLLTLAKTLRKYLNVLEKSDLAIQELGKEENMEKYSSCKTPESKLRFIKRDLMLKLPDLISFNEPYANAMPIAFAMNCFTQDWDNLLESLSGVDFEFGTDAFNVSSWGHIYPKIDVNFIKQLRNAIAHSHFDYDFDKRKIYINAYKGTFKVDFDEKILLGTPKTLWNLNKQSKSLSAWTDCAFTTDDPNDKNLYAFIIKNSNHPICDSILKDFKRTRSEDFSLADKLHAFEHFCPKLLGIYHKSSDKGIKELKRLAKQCGLEISDHQRFNVLEHTYKNNPFLKLLAETVYDGKPIEHEQLFLRGAVMRPEKSFMSNPFYHTLVTCDFAGNGNSIAKNTSLLTTNHAPFYFKEMYEYAEKSYINFIFNYLCSKIDIPEEYKLSQSIIENYSNEELIFHLRNSIVHPGRMIKTENNNYTITDYNRRGEQTFNEVISNSDLINFADSLISVLQNETQINSELE